jgi:hypothetical protein
MMLKSKIGRPTVEIEHNLTGGTTYCVRHGQSNKEYVRLGWSNDLKKTTRLVNGFEAEFERLATEIESGEKPPYHIMRMFTDNGMFRVRTAMPKLKNNI